MIDWQSISDDEFIEQANIRAAQGQWSPDRFMTQAQCDDRAKLGILRHAIVSMYCAAMHNTGTCPEWLQTLHSKCDELDGIYGNPLPAMAYAVNTSFYGKEANQDHQPKTVCQSDKCWHWEDAGDSWIKKVYDD